MRIASKTKYPDDWPAISSAMKAENNWQCERCGHKHDSKTGHTLTVHHLDGDKSNNAEWNLAVLCQRCHLYMQPVIISQLLFDFVKVSKWFVPHLEGYKKSKLYKQGPEDGSKIERI